MEAKRRLTIDYHMFRRTEIEERILGAGFLLEATGVLLLTSTLFRRTEIEVQASI